MKLIELENITKTYFLGEIDVPVLKGITLSIGKGEYVALMGASGSGKSTLMNILGCLDRQTSGEYRLDGEEVGMASGDRRAVVRNKKIGFVFQSFNLLPRTSALDNVIMPLSYTAGNLSRRECRRRGIEMLEKVGLAERMHHYPSQLSGGQQQRVAIARALINHPPVLFADEPTGNLDTRTTKEVMHMIRGFAKRFHQTIVLVSHDPEMTEYADRIVTLIDGRIVSNVENQVKAEIDAAPYIE